MPSLSPASQRRGPGSARASHEEGAPEAGSSSGAESGAGRTSLELETAALLPGGRDAGSGGGPPLPGGAEPLDWLTTALLFLFPAIGGLLFGYDIGATSGALLSMTSPEHSGTDWYSLSAFQSGLVVSLSLGGALLGSGAALLYGDKLGRKKELLTAAGLYAAASAGVAVAPTLPAVLAGRLLYGVGIGFCMHAAPAYIAETAPPRVRGLLISLKEAFIVGGILGGYGASYVFVEALGGWRYMYGLALVPAALLGAGMAFLPESPRWLQLSGAPRAAVADALRRTKGGSASEAAVQAELAEIEAAAAGGSPKAAATSAFDLSSVMRVRNMRPLAVGLSLMLFQQITGQPSVLYYAAKIFQAAGFADAGDATRVALLLGAFKLVMTGVAVATVDSWGRRPLLLWGVSGIVVSLLVLGSASLEGGPFPAEAAAWTNLIALLAYVGSYQMSFGPISWLIVGEVFPLGVRGQAIALATLTNFGSNFVVSLALPSVQEAFGPAATYFGFAAVGAVALATIYSIVPETKGRSLEEIEAMWGTGDEGDDHAE